MDWAGRGPPSCYQVISDTSRPGYNDNIVSRAARAGAGNEQAAVLEGRGVQPEVGGGEPGQTRGVQDPLQAGQTRHQRLDHQHHPGSGHRDQKVTDRSYGREGLVNPTVLCASSDHTDICC